MRPIILAVIAIAAIIGVYFALNADKGNAADPAEAAIAAAKASRGAGEPAVWTLKDEDTTIYIMGTVHLLRPELNWRSDAINQAFESADTIVFEADVSSPEAGSAMMRFIADKATFKDGRRLTSLLNASQTKELNEALDSLNFPLDGIQTMKPWFASITLSMLQVQKDGFDPTSGVETVLEAEGKADGKRFAYLETIDEQLGLMAALPDDQQVEFLIATVESIDEGAEMLDLLVDEWVDGDVNGLAIMLANPDIMGSEEMYDALLRVRNERWAPKITDMLEEPGTRLIAVGAGHLAGEDSVITLLRNQGLEVTGP
jgi:uncharacterized protein YbaP (TraB family)